MATSTIPAPVTAARQAHATATKVRDLGPGVALYALDPPVVYASEWDDDPNRYLASHAVVCTAWSRGRAQTTMLAAAPDGTVLSFRDLPGDPAPGHDEALAAAGYRRSDALAP